MTDTSASSASPEPQGTRLPNRGEEAIDHAMPQSGDGWETVMLPGQVPLAEAFRMVAEDDGLPAAVNGSSSPALEAKAHVVTQEPDPEDLVQLIQDLNQCNDALLLRVTELEDDLERSQVALQAEIERNQAQPGALPAVATPGPVQQQIAQLLSELDIANDGLRRTTIHNETLQAELEVNQQRVAQLERECTLLQQRFSEKNTALHQAEETCRDLKARLHRQQRYTLQFKAALEKCLNMAPAPATASSAAIQGQLLPSLMNEPGQPVAMPRSQQIQPWSAGPGAVTDNPSLTHLLRGLRGAGPASVPAPVEPPPERPRAPEPTFNFAEPLTPRLARASSEDSNLELFAPEPTTPATPEPSIPESTSESPVIEVTEVIEFASSAVNPVTPEPAPVADSPAPALTALDPWLEEAAAPSPTASLFTEPSPWGEPLAPVPPRATVPPEPLPTVDSAPPPVALEQPVPSSISVSAPLSTGTAPAPAPSPALPAYLTTSSKVSPSPLVYPLRSQKKIKSIAAVELPSFGRTVRRP